MFGAFAGQLAHMSEHHPRITVIALVVGAIFVGIMIWDLEASRPQREAENAAWWKAKLECRQAGGSYEYFGSLGYTCVGQR